MSEPVAWILEIDLEDLIKYKYEADYYVKVTGIQQGYDIPLYTHPMRELTDEEIENVWYEELGPSESLIDFARAILRKARKHD